MCHLNVGPRHLHSSNLVRALSDSDHIDISAKRGQLSGGTLVVGSIGLLTELNIISAEQALHCALEHDVDMLAHGLVCNLVIVILHCLLGSACHSVMVL